MSLTEEIKDFALDLGYSRVGFTSADGFPEYVQMLKSRYDMYAWFIESNRQPLAGARPKNTLPLAKSLIALVYDYSKEAFPEELTGKIGRLYLARCSSPREHRINEARYQLMREFLERNGCAVAAGTSVPARLAGARAGVVTYGNNTFAYADGIGSFIVLRFFMVNAELDHDEPTVEVACPPNCEACVEACPTGAIYEPLKMDPLRCIAFCSYHAQDGARQGVTSYIPPEIRGKMGSWIYGCDICQEVCPRNQKRLKADLPENEFLSKLAKEFSLTKLLDMSDEFYARVVHPLMFNYIKEKKYFRRNAAIAMGNTGDPAFIPDLTRATEDPEEMVRGYAAWALGRIEGSRARQILERSLAREMSESVKKEIKSALAVA